MMQEQTRARPIARPEPKQRRQHGSAGTWVRRILFYTLLLLLWEGIARLRIWPDYLFPGPFVVLETLIRLFQRGLIFTAIGVSMQRIAIGYGISLLIGIPLGLLIGRVKLARETLGSLVVGLQALPSVCWLPLAILWAGLNDRAIILTVVLGALFSIALGVESGVRNTPPLYVRAARTLGARGLSIYTQVVLPAALPSILAGLKQGWAFAWRSLMAGELLFFSLSLGNLLQTGRDLNDAAQVMAVMAVIITIGVIIDRAIFAPLETRVRRRWGLDAG